MYMLKQLPLTICASLVLLLTAPLVHAQRNNIVVVPARARMVRLGFDVHALRGVILMSYRQTDDPLQPLVHVWNRSSRSWQRVDLSQIKDTPNIPASPHQVFVIGPSAIVPDILLTVLAHATEVQVLQTFSVADILTRLDESMDFSLQEWRALAQRFDLEITEIQDERSRWGRFGPPRRYREQMEQDVPEQIIEAPAPQPRRPRETQPIRETQRITIPEPTEPDPATEAPEEPVKPAEPVEPAPTDDPLPEYGDDNDGDDAIEPVTRPLDMDETAVEEEEDFPIK